jgi:uncharacterized phage-associated protein
MTTRADLDSAFDVAFWFSDTALHENEYLQPQKLQRLLFLAQAYYAVAYDGRALFPGQFVAEEMGPIEPNVYAAFSKGRPDIDVDLFLPHDVEAFLDSVWRRFGHHSVDRLNETTTQNAAYKAAMAKGRRSEITIAMMRKAFVRGDAAPGVDQVVKPKVYLTQHGKPVTVQSWKPEKSVDPAPELRVGKPAAAPRPKVKQAPKDMPLRKPGSSRPSAHTASWLSGAKTVSRDAATVPSRARMEEEKKARLLKSELERLEPKAAKAAAKSGVDNPRLGDLGWDQVFGDPNGPRRAK